MGFIVGQVPLLETRWNVSDRMERQRKAKPTTSVSGAFQWPGETATSSPLAVGSSRTHRRWVYKENGDPEIEIEKRLVSSQTGAQEPPWCRDLTGEKVLEEEVFENCFLPWVVEHEELLLEWGGRWFRGRRICLNASLGHGPAWIWPTASSQKANQTKPKPTNQNKCNLNFKTNQPTSQNTSVSRSPKSTWSKQIESPPQLYPRLLPSFWIVPVLPQRTVSPTLGKMILWSYKTEKHNINIIARPKKLRVDTSCYQQWDGPWVYGWHLQGYGEMGS